MLYKNHKFHSSHKKNERMDGSFLLRKQINLNMTTYFLSLLWENKIGPQAI